MGDFGQPPPGPSSALYGREKKPRGAGNEVAF